MASAVAYITRVLDFNRLAYLVRRSSRTMAGGRTLKLSRAPDIVASAVCEGEGVGSEGRVEPHYLIGFVVGIPAWREHRYLNGRTGCE